MTINEKFNEHHIMMKSDWEWGYSHFLSFPIKVHCVFNKQNCWKNIKKITSILDSLVLLQVYRFIFDFASKKKKPKRIYTKSIHHNCRRCQSERWHICIFTLFVCTHINVNEQLFLWQVAVAPNTLNRYCSRAIDNV